MQCAIGNDVSAASTAAAWDIAASPVVPGAPVYSSASAIYRFITSVVSTRGPVESSLCPQSAGRKQRAKGTGTAQVGGLYRPGRIKSSKRCRSTSASYRNWDRIAVRKSDGFVLHRPRRAAAARITEV